MGDSFKVITHTAVKNFCRPLPEGVTHTVSKRITMHTYALRNLFLCMKGCAYGTTTE